MNFALMWLTALRVDGYLCEGLPVRLGLGLISAGETYALVLGAWEDGDIVGDGRSYLGVMGIVPKRGRGPLRKCYNVVIVRASVRGDAREL